MTVIKKPTSLVLLFILLITSAIFYTGCKKLDASDNLATKESGNNTQMFFNIKNTTNPIVVRVINNIKERNSKGYFINNFATKNGFAIWDKAKISFVKKVNGTESFTGSTVSNEMDTLIYIPLVKQDGTKVNGFILAAVSDSIKMSYYLNQDYVNYPFTNNGNYTSAS
jgi:hypothetical protein